MLFSTHVASRCTNHIICDVDVFFLAHQRGHKRLFSPEVHQTELASCGATKPSSLATTAGAGRQGAGWGRSLPRPSRIPPVHPSLPAGGTAQHPLLALGSRRGWPGRRTSSSSSSTNTCCGRSGGEVLEKCLRVNWERV